MVMSCARAACYCLSEVFVERDGGLYCSEHCASAPPATATPCACQHQGCAGSDEQALAEGLPALAEDARLR
jgi:hypothetical protein